MTNLPRNEIIEIATNLLNSGDIVAKHGTSIKNAQSIINTGFDFHRTSFVVQSSKSIDALCGYGWKDNGPDDAANVIIEIPREFFKDLLSFDNDEYQNWIQRIIDNNDQEAVIDSVTTFETKPAQKIRLSSGTEFTYPSTFSAHIPREFIAGAFVWCNGKTYLNLEEGESALDNLTYIPNNNYYLSMNPDDKKDFIEKMRLKIGIEVNSKKR